MFRCFAVCIAGIVVGIIFGSLLALIFKEYQTGRTPYIELRKDIRNLGGGIFGLEIIPLIISFADLDDEVIDLICCYMYGAGITFISISVFIFIIGIAFKLWSR